MKAPVYEFVEFDSSQILARRLEQESFDGPYHYHTQFELTYIEKGSGERFVGKTMSTFTGGDLVLLGSNLPHKWKSITAHDSPGLLSAMYVQFGGNLFSKTPHFNLAFPKVTALLERSQHGIQFFGGALEMILAKIRALIQESDDLRRLILLYEIIDYLADSKDYTIVDKDFDISTFHPKDRNKMNLVFSYLIENYRGDVSLEKAAAVINLTQNSFCKYFKKVTGKSFFSYVIEYRLHHAVELLVKTGKPVADICYESGFDNIPYFNRTFKNAFGVSPLRYRNQRGL